jgi:hypothetical protein
MKDEKRALGRGVPGQAGRPGHEGGRGPLIATLLPFAEPAGLPSRGHARRMSYEPGKSADPLLSRRAHLARSDYAVEVGIEMRNTNHELLF